MYYNYSWGLSLDKFQIIVLVIALVVVTLGVIGAYTVLLAYKIKQKTLMVPVYVQVNNKKTLIGYMGTAKEHDRIEVKLFPSYPINERELYEIFGECVIEVIKQDAYGRFNQFNLLEYHCMIGEGRYNG